MTFEWDPAKSAANKIKHGIDFEEAQVIWDDARRVEFPATNQGEPRFQVVGDRGGKLWSAIITYRADNIRIISVRRARRDEERSYEANR